MEITLMKNGLAILLIALLSACASKAPKLEGTDAGAADAGNEFQRGTAALEKEDYSTAADVFDHLLVAKPATEVDLITIYNSGNAYEGLGNCKKASERYREAVRSSAGKFTRIEAQSLFRLSLMYECLGQDTKTVTALLDTRKRAKELPIEIERAELPARLAAAYSRLGNRTKALEYFNQANSGLKAVLAKGSSARAQKDTLARTLYYMGHLNPAQKTGNADPNSYLQSLSMQQPYLLQAVEMGSRDWSHKAAEDLDYAYDNMTRFTLDSPQKRREFFTRCLQVIAELRRIRLPDAGKAEDDVFARVDSTERRIQIELASTGETTRLTPDAEKREGLRREGRLVDPKASPAKRLNK
jgi:tetratricopeptide (TPR) repeat protein